MRNRLLPILLFFSLYTWGTNKEANYNNLCSDTLTVNAAKEDTTAAHVLEEAVVSAKNVKHYANHDEVLITPKMRRGIGTAFEILEKIQGIRFDKLENSLEVNFSKKIAMQVNGTERSKEYINSIHPDRIKKVEVTCWKICHRGLHGNNKPNFRRELQRPRYNTTRL